MEISQIENYIGKFKDKRLDKRASLLSGALYFGRTSSIPSTTLTEADQKAATVFWQMIRWKKRP